MPADCPFELLADPSLRSLPGQDYADFEVIVLDDGSTDETGPLLLKLARQNSRLSLLGGKPLPLGWLGKHWASCQLPEAARVILHQKTHSETIHQPNMLRDSVAAL